MRALTGLTTRPGALAAVLVGLASSLVTSVYFVRWLRPALLMDADPGWAVPRLLLWLALTIVAAAAGGAAAGAFFLWARSRRAATEILALPFSGRTTAVLAAAALAVGVLLRVAPAGRLPIPFTDDEVNLITPALELTGTTRDFADSIRGIPYGIEDPHEMIGVVYLYLLRASLEVFGPGVLGLQAPSILGGVLSLFTGAALGRTLLPRGGAALAGLVLAGLRWHLILSVRGWHAILLTVLSDLAALAVLAARRRSRPGVALAGGLLVGLGAHLYFSAWIAAAALGLLLLWPREGRDRWRPRVLRAAAFTTGVLLAASPLFLLREGRQQSVLDRIGYQNVVVETGHAKSPMPLFLAVAEPLLSPWFIPDPEAINDLPHRSRLGWIVGIPFAAALGWALLAPRKDFSAFLLAHLIAAFAAAVATGEARSPHGTRFAHLTTVTAVAAAAGVLFLLSVVSARARRAWALGAVGVLSIGGALAARDALAVWPSHRATFESYVGQNTLRGLAAARWERYGAVEVAEDVGHTMITVDTVRRYRLDPFGSLPRSAVRGGPEARARTFRIVPPGTVPKGNERVVERIRDAWGREWGIVIGRRSSAGSAPRKLARS